MSNAEWITNRLPTEADGDGEGDVRLRSRSRSSEYNFAHWSYVGPGAPWQHTSYWQSPAEPAPAEPDRAPESARDSVKLSGLKSVVCANFNDPVPKYKLDRITALEQRVAEHIRSQSILAAALVKRLDALEGMPPDGAVSAKVPGGLPVLEQRVAELEAQIARVPEAIATAFDLMRAQP
jgi:hypothetical protein